ncbi:antigen 5 like allergen Cul n 1-like [Ochlerotatus camptorhynchus]|uniref:antigen 5 like allergen Cul n 1-like n=1 Tax=Ochlerotatus camptorhynchus TaxID=644619 RepID=UPI0031CEAA16
MINTNKVSTNHISVTSMVFKTYIIFALLAVTLHKGGASNGDKYCGKDVCPEGLRNIGCGCDSSSYGVRCAGRNARKIKIDGKLKALVIEKHNMWRDMLACGSVKPHPPAARMTEVTWDDELEYLAECNTKRCVYGHDQCRSTSEFPFAGQNIASKLLCGRTILKPEEMIVLSVDIWFQEHKNTTPSMTDRYPGKLPGGPIGHFTVMVNDIVRRIGCSFIVYEEQGKRKNQNCHKYYLVCNYSYSNFVGEKTYTKTQEPAKECFFRSDQYSCLCGSNQPSNPE